MARIAGVNIPSRKRVLVALRYIYGIGPYIAKDIVSKAGLSDTVRVHELTEEELNRVRSVVENDCAVEGELRREIGMNLKRLMSLGCYRGLRHRKRLPVRGQRTHTNARTRKGPSTPKAVKR